MPRAAVGVLLATISLGLAASAAYGGFQPSATAVAAPGDLAGIAQKGNALGSPSAQLTLVEFADLQCPYCAVWAAKTLPVLVREYIRTGKLRIVFRGIAFLGADSLRALQAVEAAGLQNRLWNLVEGLYARQGAENSGWVTDTLLRSVGAAVSGLDTKRMLAARTSVAVASATKENVAAAVAAKVGYTPFFLLGRTGGRLAKVEITSLAPTGIRPAIDRLLAAGR